MSAKIAWAEGLSLLPHHFQRSDELVRREVAGRMPAPPSRAFGFTRLVLDTGLLASGVCSLSACRGIFPGDIAFDLADLPGNALRRALPDGLGRDFERLRVHVAMPAPSEAVPAVGTGASSPFLEIQRPLRDLLSGGDERPIGLLVPNLRLVFSNEPLDGLVHLPVCDLIRGPSGQPVISGDFHPIVLDIHAAPELVRTLEGLIETVRRRLELLEHQNPATDPSGMRAWLESLHLAGALPSLRYMASHCEIHPEELFRQLLSLYGGVRCARAMKDETFEYRHSEMSASLGRIFIWLRNALSAVSAARHLIRRLERESATVFRLAQEVSQWQSGKRFHLAVRSALPPEALAKTFVQQAKVAPRSKLQAIIMSALQGFELRAVGAPSFFRADGHVCFELIASGPLWSLMLEEGALGVFCPPNLEISSIELLVELD